MSDEVDDDNNYVSLSRRTTASLPLSRARNDVIGDRHAQVRAGKTMSANKRETKRQ